MEKNLLGDASTSVAPTSRERIGSAHDFLVEESGAPHLTRDEGATEDSDKETQCNQTLGVSDQTRQGSRNGTTEKQSNEDQAWPEAITQGPSDEPNEKTGICQIFGSEGDYSAAYVARRATMFELATSVWLMWRSPLMVTVNWRE